MRGTQDRSLKPRTVHLAADPLDTAVNHENESIHAEFEHVEFKTAPKLQ